MSWLRRCTAPRRPATAAPSTSRLCSACSRTMSKLSSARMGVGLRNFTVNERVLPDSPVAQFWCWMTQSKNTARKPPCTRPGGPSYTTGNVTRPSGGVAVDAIELVLRKARVEPADVERVGQVDAADWPRRRRRSAAWHRVRRHLPALSATHQPARAGSSTAGCGCSSDKSWPARRRSAPAAATVCASGCSPNRGVVTVRHSAFPF